METPGRRCLVLKRSVVTGGTGTKRGHDNMSRMMKLGWAGLGSAAACSQIVCRLSLLHHNSTHRQHTQAQEGCRVVCLVSHYEPFPSACQDISHPSESEPYGDTSWIKDDCPDTFYEFIFLYLPAAALCHDFSLVDSVET